MGEERSAASATQSADGAGRDGNDLELVVLEQRSLSRRTLTSVRTLQIGRADDCDVVLQDPAASRRHAILHVGSQLAIEDLDSRNGTRVCGVRLPARQRTSLQLGDAVKIGGATLFVQRGATCEGGACRMEPSSGVEPADTPHDPEMGLVHEWIARVAPSDITVLISGETGVGKEVAAEAIHRASGARSHMPLLRINCAALSLALFESELFGHERGAFTGAARQKVGLFEAANGGTAFLDEIGELPLEAQAKLLRVLETREVVRVGGLKPRRVDVRFIAATNRDLRAEIICGAFREDLFFRLNGASVVVPPLRRRPAELESLAAHFLDTFCHRLHRPAPSLGPAALEQLRRYSWPGNIRELRNVVQCAVLRARGPTIDVDDLPPEVGGATDPCAPTSFAGEPDSLVAPAPADQGLALSEAQRAERARIVGALVACHGNQTRAAEGLAMSRRTLVAKLTTYGIPRPRSPRRDPAG
jgi:two-component system response regulator AtoC